MVISAMTVKERTTVFYAKVIEGVIMLLNRLISFVHSCEEFLLLRWMCGSSGIWIISFTWLFWGQNN